jgi:hypothetical protein
MDQEQEPTYSDEPAYKKQRPNTPPLQNPNGEDEQRGGRKRKRRTRKASKKSRKSRRKSRRYRR